MAETTQTSAPEKASTSEQAQSARRASGATVVVACKIPVGLELQCSDEQEYQEEYRDTEGRQRTRARARLIKAGPVVLIAGTAYPVGQAPAGFRDKPMMAGGYALTFGVNKDFFDRWMEQNKLNPIVVNRMIFGYEKIEEVRAKARNYADLKSGLEPLSPDDDPRMPRPLAAGVTGVHPADEMSGRQRVPVAAE